MFKLQDLLILYQIALSLSWQTIFYVYLHSHKIIIDLNFIDYWFAYGRIFLSIFGLKDGNIYTFQMLKIVFIFFFVKIFIDFFVVVIVLIFLLVMVWCKFSENQKQYCNDSGKNSDLNSKFFFSFYKNTIGISFVYLYKNRMNAIN